MKALTAALLLSASMLALLFLGGCDSRPAPPAAPREFSTYDEAERWVRKNYRSETMRPQSTYIAKVVFPRKSGR